MQPTVYVSKQAILEEAGFAQVQLADDLDGTADGSNKVFTTSHKPLIDANYDDNLDATDVTVYVNGIAVAVASVSGASGTITLQAAPGNGAAVTADYVFSPIKDQAVCDVRDEAQTHVNEIMSTIETVPYANYPDTPPTIRKITRWIAAGMLLARDYGSGTTDAGTSKAGDAKMKTAEGWLEHYLEMGGFTGGNTNPFADADIAKGRDVFGERGRHHHFSSTPVDNSFIRGTDDGLGGGDEDDWL